METYKKIDHTQINSSPYSAMRGPFSKYYSIFNDGIQKFSMELNGVMLRTLTEKFEVTNIPWALTKIAGGSMDARKLCSQIISIVSSVQQFGSNPFQDAKSEFVKEHLVRFPDLIPPTPPTIFKCCSLSSLDFELKNIHMI